MKIEYRRKFLKELPKIPVEKRSRMEHFVFKELPEANSIFESGRVESMKGYPSYFKVRFGHMHVVHECPVSLNDLNAVSKNQFFIRADLLKSACPVQFFAEDERSGFNPGCPIINN